MKKLRVSLRTAIMIPLIAVFMLIIGSVTIVQSLTYDKMVRNISEKQLSILTQNVKANLENFLLAPFKVSQTMSDGVEYRVKGARVNFDQLKDYLFYAYQNLKVHVPQFSFIAFGSEITGDFIGIKHISEDEFYFMRSKKGDLVIYNDKNEQNVKEVIPNYNARIRPWYIPAANAKKPVWSELYMNLDQDAQLTMSALSPIIQNGNLLGVFATDINLDKFGDFLSLQLERNNASIFIFDDDGLLIANSSSDMQQKGISDFPTTVRKTPFSETKQTLITETSSPLINKAAQTALNLSLHKSENDDVYSFKYKNKRYFGVITPYQDGYGLDWNIAIVLPESELVGNLPQLQHSALFGLMFYCALIIIIGSIVFNHLTSNIKATATAASAFAKGDWNIKAPDDSKINEIQKLGIAFNNMSSHIQMSFSRLQHQLQYDSLTHLLKRKGLFDQYDLMDHKKGMLVLFGIEKFNEINDSLGLDKADKVLIQIAKKIKSISPGNALVARVSGYEFAIYLPNILNEQCAQEFIYRLQAQFHLPLQIDAEFVVIHHAISSAPTQANQAMSDSLRNALIALSNARKNPLLYATYHPEMAEVSVRRNQIVSQITKAIESDEFIPFYQPLVDLKTNKVIGAEALARWISPEYGLIPPDDFIPLSEEYGLIHKIGYQILLKACHDTQQAIEEGRWDKNFHLHVNISVNQLQVASFGQNLKNILKETRLSTKNLSLELTESNFMDNSLIIEENMALIKSLGIGIAIDDFGTGYSSLSCLQQIEFNCLKIDRSFISNMSLDPDEDSVVSAILVMTRNFNTEVVAEGIEEIEQAQVLTALGCDIGQGYLYSKPLPLEQWPYDVSGKIS